MIGDLFDSPWKIAIIAVVIIVMFGSRKLPEAARSLGKSMRILKTEVSKLHEDDETASSASVPAAPAQLEPTASTTAAQAQIDALSQQIASLQQTVAASGAPSANNVSDSAQAK
jgi:sec-independent protein translocase protein TatA